LTAGQGQVFHGQAGGGAVNACQKVYFGADFQVAYYPLFNQSKQAFLNSPAFSKSPLFITKTTIY
jgi:hypothetical protein